MSVYRYTAEFPKSETYGLAAQLCRAVSVPANIAEGFRKSGRQDRVRFMNIAQGSLEECRYYLILARDLKYGEDNSLMPLLEEVSRMLDAYAKAILTPDS
jgi:four helix bundle protein